CSKCKDKSVLKECECGCSTIIGTRNRWGRPQQYLSGHNGRGSLNPKWIGGRTIGSDGYWLISFNGQRIRENRLVYEIYYNCCLLPYTIIHCKNGIKTDNSIDNLQVLFRRELSSLQPWKKPPVSI